MQSKVSVFMITYNHQDYIGEAIESVMNQDYENLELVIGEDCSTDNTREIVCSYKNKYPGKIKLILHEKNLGIHLNTKSVIEQCDGDYVALIEGDDFWIDNTKISQQVEFLENNLEYAICCHRAKILNQTSIPFAEYLPSLQSTREEFDILDIINGVYLPTATTLFRNQKNYHLIGWLNTEEFYIDRMFYLLNSLHGKIKFLSTTMSVYRVHEEAQWSVKQDEHRIEALERRRNILELFNGFTEDKFADVVNKSIKKCNAEILIEKVIKQGLDKSNMQQLQSMLNRIINGKNIYIFGTGRGGKKAREFMEEIYIKCHGYLDNDSKKWDETVNNLKVYNPNTFEYSNNFVFIASEFHKEISAQLETYGLIPREDFYLLLDFLVDKGVV